MADGGGDGEGHGAEVDGDVGCLGDHVAVGVEDGAREVEALLHVGGVGGALKCNAHLLSNGDEQVLEDFEANGVYQGAPPGLLGGVAGRLSGVLFSGGNGSTWQKCHNVTRFIAKIFFS